MIRKIALSTLLPKAHLPQTIFYYRDLMHRMVHAAIIE